MDQNLMDQNLMDQNLMDKKSNGSDSIQGLVKSCSQKRPFW